MIKLLLLWQGVKHSLADPRGREVKDAARSHDINILVHQTGIRNQFMGGIVSVPSTALLLVGQE